MMTTTTIPAGVELRAICPHELTAWAQLTGEPEQALRRLVDDPQADLQGVLAAFSGDRPIACCRVLRRTIYLSGRRVQAGIVDEVHAVCPDFPTEALLGRAVSYMRGKGISVALCRDAGEADGWAYVPSLWRSVRFSGPQAEIRPLCEEDVARVRGLYGLWAGAFDGLMVREHPEHWDRWICGGWKNPHVLLEDGETIAYADWEEEDDGLLLRDWAQKPGREDLLTRFIGGIAGGREARIPAPLAGGEGTEVSRSGLYVSLLAPIKISEIDIADTQSLADALSGAVWLPAEFR